MRVLPSVIAIGGIIALVLVNTDLSMPRYKGVQHSVGSDIASVYTADDDSSAPLVPIQRLQIDSKNQSSSLSDTGQRVHVYIKNTYRDDDIRRAHSATIRVLVFFVLLYGAAILVRALRDRRKRI